MNQGGEVKLITLHGADEARKRSATIVVTVTGEGTTLKQAGMKTTKNVMNQGGEVKLITLHGADEARKRSATIVVTVTGEGTTLAVTHQSEK